VTVPTVDAVLRLHGPLRARAIANHLTAAGLTPATARQRIARADGSVRRVGNIRLPHNEGFFCLQEQLGSTRLLEALMQVFIETDSAYGFGLSALASRGGLIPTPRFDIISGCPVTMPRQVPSRQVREELESVGLLRRTTVPELGTCFELAIAPPNATTYRRIRATTVVEDVLLAALREWARKVGLVSYDKVRTRSPDQGQPIVGSFHWDLTAPTFARPFVSFEKGKALGGFFVADVQLSASDITERQIAYFLRKCELHDATKARRPFLPAFIGSGFTHAAFMAAKRAGILVATPEAFFGDEVGAAIRALLSLLTTVAENAQLDPGAVQGLFGTLGRIEGAAMNVRGPLFEFIVAHCVRRLEATDQVRVGLMATHPETNERADVDVLRLSTRRATIYECKATAPLTVAQVTDWVTRQVPRVRAWLAEEYPNFTHAFELWSTGGFEPAALDYLRDRKAATQAYALEWRGPEEVRTYVAPLDDRRVMEVLNEQFLRHPLAS
jgi:hypothetical protein